MGKTDLKSIPLAALYGFVTDLGEPRFRTKQIYTWLHRRHVASFSQMTDLSLDLREKLEEKCYINSLTTKKKLVSALDGTVKYLYGLRDGEHVESVLMRHHHGLSLCISTQVGCKMGCRFCASTIGGLKRNLTAAEMLAQIYRAEQDQGEPIGGVVLMGIGEPLDNFANVVDFLTILSSPEGRNLSLRHVSLSTCGLVDKIDELAKLRLPLTLSVSLHAADNPGRDAIMPVNRQYPVEELLAACARYFAATGRRISFEYALIRGQNDSVDQAHALAARLRKLGGREMPCHVNLIPVNPVAGRDFRRGDRDSIRRFQAALEKGGVNATVRRELGADIAAACGQLRRDSIEHGL